jgi:hypothetical protein
MSEMDRISFLKCIIIVSQISIELGACKLSVLEQPTIKSQNFMIYLIFNAYAFSSG